MTDPGLNNKSTKLERFRYKGTSMLPTFKPGQMLYIRPEGRSPEAGDVVVFREDGKYIVHRVDRLEGSALRTRGDNNPIQDAKTVPLTEVIGVVEQASDWGKIHAIRGGKPGLMRARFRWWIRRFLDRVSVYIGAPYRWIKARQVIGHIWHPQVTIIKLITGEGEMVKYIVRGKTVATWTPSLNRFKCKKPYDLLIHPPVR